MFLFPFLDSLRRHALHPQVHTRHVVGRIHHKEQDESKQIHTDKDGNGIQSPANDVGKHQLLTTRACRFSCRR